MYKMPEFTEKDMQLVAEFMHAHPFVTLIGCNDNMSVATQVPVLIEEREDGTMIVRGHIMRKTDHHIAFEQNPEALVLFTGPQCYVSASWYSERGIGSTWNYMTVHARGKMQFMDSEHTLQLITDLTHKYEDTRTSPELVENMKQEEYVQPMLRAIVSFEIVIEDTYPLFKLSQNRDDKSYMNIVEQLMNSDNIDSISMAGELIRQRPHLFE